MTRSFRLNFGGTMFFLIHLSIIFAFWVGVDWKAIAMCVFFFLIRKFGITGGYHRYFSHRSYKTSRFFQFCLGFLGGMSTQKGALWWAAHHRHHHKHSDTEEDIHSAEREGFWWSHVGWVLSPEYDNYDEKSIGDLAKYPELRWLDKHHYVPPITLALICYLMHGWMGLVWGYVISTVILWHTTFAINSLCHMFGRRRYETGESSKNSLWLAVVTLGEGWHNNHHHYPLSCRQGFFWWEIDPTYYCIWTLSKLGIVWDVKAPPQRLLGKDSWTATPFGKPDAVRPSPRNVPPAEIPAH